MSIVSIMPQPPTPKNGLSVYRLLAPSAAVRVSPICLGAMNFGEAWKGWLGTCNKDTAFEMLDFFYENGGNFIDTASNYQNEESEKWIGEWMEKRGVRDEMVIATKYTSCYSSYRGFEGKKDRIHANRTGNGTKSLHESVANSLKKLRTNYIDVLYVHWWDFATSIEEVMISLNHLVAQGKVLYLGISDTPAWIVSKANQYARDHGLRPFVVYQGHWSAALRDFEREIIPMCLNEGMGLAPWGALGGGKFKTAQERKNAEGRGAQEITEHEKKVCDKLEEVAKKQNTSMTSIALAYVMHKAPYVFPICGGRSTKHMQANFDALAIELSDEDIKNIDSADQFDIGFPSSMVGQKPGEMFLLGISGKFAYYDHDVKPIKPSSLGIEKSTK